jgi:hypothetical protein
MDKQKTSEDFGVTIYRRFSFGQEKGGNSEELSEWRYHLDRARGKKQGSCLNGDIIRTGVLKKARGLSEWRYHSDKPR